MDPLIVNTTHTSNEVGVKVDKESPLIPYMSSEKIETARWEDGSERQTMRLHNGTCPSLEALQLKAAQKQAQVYKNDLTALRKQIALQSGSSYKVLALENEASERLAEIQRLKDENRSLMRIQREQAKALEQLECNSDMIPAKIAQLNEEVRFHKSQVHDLKLLRAKDASTMTFQHEQIVLLEAKVRHLTEVSKGKLPDKNKHAEELTHRDQIEEKLNNQIKVLKRVKEQDDARLKSLNKELQVVTRETRSVTEDLEKSLKRTEQELRFYSLKVKGVRKLMKEKRYEEAASEVDYIVSTADAMSANNAKQTPTLKDTEQMQQKFDSRESLVSPTKINSPPSPYFKIDSKSKELDRCETGEGETDEAAEVKGTETELDKTPVQEEPVKETTVEAPKNESPEKPSMNLEEPKKPPMSVKKSLKVVAKSKSRKAL